jgi:glycosyltransferase involved in cell wall biosynthesis
VNKNKGYLGFVQSLKNLWHKVPFGIRTNNLVRGFIHLLNNIVIIPRKLSNTKKHKELLDSILGLEHKQVVVFYPTYDWDIPLFQRPQHFAQEFARAGYLVFFCTPNNYDIVNGFQQIEENLFVTNRYQLVLHRANIVVGYATDPNFSSRSLKKIFKFVDVFIYDFLDEMHPNLNGQETKDLRERHATAVNHPKTIVTVSAKSLAEKVLVLNPKSALLYLPNACNYKHFENHRKNETQKITIGYFGALASWFDFELVVKMAERYNDLKVKLIGQDYDGSILKYDLSNLPNIEVIPPIDYNFLPNEAQFDIGIIPFRINAITLATSPIKIFEYLAMGLPVVSTDLPECREIPGVSIAKNHKEFLEQIEVAILRLGDTSLEEARKKFAKNQTWEHRVASLIQTINLKNLG